MKKLATIITSCVLLALSGCDTPQLASYKAQLPPHDLVQVNVDNALQEWQGQHGGRLDVEHKLINDERDWIQLWQTLGSEPPSLDLTKYIAVVVMIGQRTTGGYHIEFLKPILKEIDLTVRYLVTIPTGATMQMMTSPWKIKAYQRVAGKVHIKNITKASASAISKP